MHVGRFGLIQGANSWRVVEIVGTLPGHDGIPTMVYASDPSTKSIALAHLHSLHKQQKRPARVINPLEDE